MSFSKPISISLSPNIEKDDVKLALNLIIRPWLWRIGRKQKPSGINQLEDKFKRYLDVKYAVSFNSGRSAFYAILRALGLPGSSEVLLQAFTCNAAINPVLWAKMRPMYVDCDSLGFNIDINDLKQKITLRQTQGKPFKILMVQHTFGNPANMDQIVNIVRQSNLILIEDCAHALGAEWGGQKIGTFGKASFFSFSRDKIISSVYGGMAVTNDDEIGKKLLESQKQFGMPGRYWIFQQLLHPIFLHFIILPVYNFLYLGKIFLLLAQWFYVLSKAVHWKEKRGLKPDYFPKALPNAMAVMALNQFNKLDEFYRHRERLFKFYYKNLQNTSFILPEQNQQAKQSYLRFTIQHPKAHDIIYDAWHKQNILLGDWYTTVIAPYDTKLEEMQYKTGACPNAEWLAKRTLNLPTNINISMKDAEKVINLLKKYA